MVGFHLIELSVHDPSMICRIYTPHLVVSPQIRVPVAEVPGLLRKLSDMLTTWGEASKVYPAQATAEAE